ncbi:MAG: hypothetical protein ABIG09_03605 [bacterium]
MKYSVPLKNKEFILVPSLGKLAEIAEANQARLKDLEIKGLPFSRLRDDLRREVIEKDRSANNKEVIVGTGHQPILYHPGIFFKEMVINALLEKHGYLGINLVIDTDAFNHHQDTFWPDFQEKRLSWEEMRFPQVKKDLAFEEMSSPHQEELKQWFSQLKEKCSKIFPKENLLTLSLYEEDTYRASLASHNLGQLVTFSKRKFEERLNFKHQEVFLSSLSETLTFAYFFALILSLGREFGLTYNKLLENYRQEKKISHRLTPFPNLKISSDLIELPFWIWRAKEPRSSLFLKFHGQKAFLGTLNKEILEINYTFLKLKKIESLVKINRELKDKGYKLRPKALMITLFMRLFFCDLWIHGVGGAGYEEINDRLSEEIFSVSLPPYGVASATLYLNFNLPLVTNQEVKELQDNLRKMKFNSQEFVDLSIAGVKRLVKEKESLLNNLDQVKEKKKRTHLYQKLSLINEELRSLIASQIKDLEGTIMIKERLLKDKLMAENRRFPFFLVPLEELRSLYRGLF